MCDVYVTGKCNCNNLNTLSWPIQYAPVPLPHPWPYSSPCPFHCPMDIFDLVPDSYFKTDMDYAYTQIENSETINNDMFICLWTTTGWGVYMYSRCIICTQPVKEEEEEEEEEEGGGRIKRGVDKSHREVRQLWMRIKI